MLILTTFSKCTMIRFQVTLFINRALKDRESIYTMAHCEKLTFSACKEIELRVSRFSDSNNEKLGLVFLYAKEDSNARIRAYLDKYLVKTASLLEPEQLRDYVSTRIFHSDTDTSASIVDTDR